MWVASKTLGNFEELKKILKLSGLRLKVTECCQQLCDLGKYPQAPGEDIALIDTLITVLGDLCKAPAKP